MLGLLGSLGGSLLSGVFGMMGQSSANNQAMQMSSTAYQRSYADMTKAGLNPAMMYNSGGGPASTPPIGNTMAAPAAALKDAASSAVQMQIADKTIEQLTSQIAKQRAETANVKAALPGIAGEANVKGRESDAILGIPKRVFVPLASAGYGARQGAPLGTAGSFAGATAASGKSVATGVAETLGVDPSSAKAAYRSAVKRARASDESDEIRAKRKRQEWGEWMFGSPARGSTVYQQ